MNSSSLRFPVGRALLHIGGFAVLLWLAWSVVLRAVDLEEVGRLLASFPSDMLIVALVLSLGIMLIRSWRFYMLLRQTDVTVSLWGATKAFIAGQALAPFPGGEAARGALLAQESGMPFRAGAGALIVQGFVELLVAALLAAIGSVFVPSLRLMVFLGAAFIVLSMAFFLSPAILGPLAWLGRRLSWLEGACSVTADTQQQVRESIFQAGTHRPTGVFLLSLASSLVTLLAGAGILALASRAYEMPVGFPEAAVVQGGGMVVSLLDNISPVGIGFSDGGMVGLLALMGAGVSAAVAAVLIFRAVTLLFGASLGLLFLLAFYAKPFIIQAANHESGK